MSTESFQQRGVSVIRLMTEAATLRAGIQKDLAERVAAEAASIEAEHKRLISEAAQGFSAQYRGLEETRDAELSALDERWRERVQTLQTDAAAKERAAESRAATLKQKIERDHQDAKWLAETMIEPGEAKLREAHEGWTRAVETLRKEAGSLREAYADAFPTRRKRELVVSPVAVELVGAGALPAHELARECIKALNDDLPGFRAAADPPAGRPGVNAVVGLLAAIVAAGAAMGAGLAAPIAGGVGAGAALLAVGVCRVIAVGRGRDLPARISRASEHFGRVEFLEGVIAERSTLERSEGSVWLRKRRDDDIARANDEYRVGMRGVDRIRKVDLPELRAANQAKLDEATRAAASERAALEQSWKTRLAEIKGRRDELVAAADAKRDARRTALEFERTQTIRSASERWTASMTEANSAREAIDAGAAACGQDHESRAASGGPAPRGVRIGSLRVDLSTLPGGVGDGKDFLLPCPAAFDMPVMFDLAGSGGLLVFAGDQAKGAGDGRERTLALLRSVMANLLSTLPPGKARFTIFDPIGLGQNFAGFMHLADADPLLVSGRIWTETKDIEQRLADLTEHMETVIQKYLRNEYPTIQDYNVAAGEVAEPYRFLVLADFPNNISEHAARRLASIVTSGARCGVFVLIGAEPRDRVSLKGPLADLEKSCLTLTRRGESFAIDSAVLSAWPLTLDPLVSDEALTPLVKAIGQRAKDSSRVRVPFTMITPEPGMVWSGSSAQELSIPLGRAGAKRIQHLTLGRGTAQHALIAGRTGSGKSTLLHIIVTNAALWFSPDQLELYLIDFKKGVEFKAYAAANLPHARVIAIESEREFGLSVLKRLDEELSRRGELLRDAGVQDLTAYRRDHGENSMPRILLVIDEFQEFFTQDDRIGAEAALLLDRLVRQGRAFGVHVLLGSQTLGGAFSIARSTIGQMAVRVALQCSEADSYLILSEDNAAARLLTRPGEAIYNDASGMSEGNSPFQIAWIDDAQRSECLASVAAESRRRQRASTPCVVFEGNAPADLRSNARLLAPAAADGPTHERRLWLGEPLAIKEPTAARLRRESASNLLMVGADADSMAGMFAASLLSIGGWSGPQRPLVCLVMASSPDEATAGLLPELAGRIDAEVRVLPVRDAAGAVRDVASTLDAAGRDGAGRPTLLAIWGLQRCRDLRRADDFDFSSSGDGEESPAKALTRVLIEGPPQGVHTLVWCDTVTNLERTLDRTAIREFGTRVVTQMSATDSTTLIDAPGASDLGRFRALLHVVEAGTNEKFRPYRPPERAWIESLPRVRPESADPVASES
jgi:hypothetical protein